MTDSKSDDELSTEVLIVRATKRALISDEKCSANAYAVVDSNNLLTTFLYADLHQLNKVIQY